MIPIVCVPAVYVLKCQQKTNTLPNSITIISLSRFLFGLRDIAYNSDVLSSTGDSLSRSHVSTLEFSRIVGPLGNVVSSNISSGLNQEVVDEDNEIEYTDTAHSVPVTDIELESIGSHRV